MDAHRLSLVPQDDPPYRIVDLNYVSLYVKEFEEATAFFRRTDRRLLSGHRVTRGR